MSLTDKSLHQLSVYISRTTFKGVGKITHLDATDINTDNGFQGTLYGKTNTGRLTQMIKWDVLAYGPGPIIWKNIRVRRSFRGHNLGRFALNCGIAVAIDRNERYIELRHVQESGPGFWTYYGAELPNKEKPTKIASAVESYLELVKKELTSQDKVRLNRILQMNKTNPSRAWHMLAQSRIKSNLESANSQRGRTIQEYVFSQHCLFRHLVIDLENDRTKRIMKAHLIKPMKEIYNALER